MIMCIVMVARGGYSMIKINIDWKTTASVIKTINDMTSVDTYKQHTPGKWILGYIDEVYKCGLITKDEHIYLIETYDK